MRENRLRTLIDEGKPTFGTRVQSSWPTIIEIVGRSQNFDYVEFLAEYAPYDLYALDNMARAIELSPNFTGLIKIERSAQAHVAVRAMAAGIQNVLFTDVRSKADAEDCVRTVKPEIPGSVGTHGNDAGRAAIGGVPELIKRYEDSVVVLMIEKKGAVENLEGILSVKGVDMVQFGPSDYSMSIGLAGQRQHPAVVEAYEHTIKTAIKMGVRPRAEISTPEDAEYYMNLGVKDFNLSTDTAILAAFYRASGSALREMVAAGVKEAVPAS
ncbi:MAG: 2,4-dihydroxyhept-2-ene-1,7-dioic acid aldolase [Chloroflexi bacterium]|nr:2,4-dihydroxyhept-2-ene-1,7-dioic acid aldolase [Chloroflexota bacterium]MBV9598384.1 2,4-dihydroxyhept-2-ene-1,7-dioic acid aldolase [Chloroflexota bacterium]